MKKSCAYKARNGCLPFGTTGDATHLGGDTYYFEPHGYDLKLTLDKSALTFHDSLPKYPTK